MSILAFFFCHMHGLMCMVDVCTVREFLPVMCNCQLVGDGKGHGNVDMNSFV